MSEKLCLRIEIYAIFVRSDLIQIFSKYEETYFWRMDDSGETVVLSRFRNAGNRNYSLPVLERL